MRNLIFYCIVFVISFSSCMQEKVNDSSVMENEIARPFDLSEKEVLSIVESFQKSIIPNQQTRAEKIALTIKDKYLISSGSGKTRTLNDEINPLIYEVEMDAGFVKGKTIVSGDKRFPKVLAYIPAFNDSLCEISLEPQMMVQMAKNAFLDKIRNYTSEGITRSFPDSIHGELNVMVPPFCVTEWGVGAPYNQLLPKAWIQYTEGVGGRPGYAMYGNYKTGASVTTIAQIMAYWQHSLDIDGVSIDWEALTMEKSVAKPYYAMVAKLFKYIYDITDTHPVWGQSYNDNWPPSIVNSVIAMETPISDLSKVLTSSKCGLIFDGYHNWNLGVIKKSIISIQPVFVSDRSRFAFVIDGYAISEEYEKDNVYVHCNFGRSGQFDGYFLVYDDGRVVIELNGLTYIDTDLSIIPYIRSK